MELPGARHAVSGVTNPFSNDAVMTPSIHHVSLNKSVPQQATARRRVFPESQDVVRSDA